MIRLLLLLLAFGTASATDWRKVDVDVKNEVNNQVEGATVNNDVNVGTGDTMMDAGDVNFDSKAYALSNYLGDVDINDCMGSTQFGTPIFSKQKLALNKWCAAETYDAKGLKKLAARMRCQIKEIASLFPDNESCVTANIVPDPPPPIPAAVEHDRDDEDERFHVELAQRIERIEKDRQAEAEKAARYARAAKAEAERVQEIENSRQQVARELYEELKDYGKK